jgi:hypothetical protein
MREHIVENVHRHPVQHERSPSFPVHAIPLVLITVFAFTTIRAFGVIRTRFLDAVKDSPFSITPATTSSTHGQGELTLFPGLADNPNLMVFTPEVQRWGVQIERWAEIYNLPEELVAIVMQIESCGDPTAVSSAGARGLFQVMPFHFISGEDWMDAETNAARGMDYLAGSYQLAQGSIDLTLAGYNGGHSVIARPPSTWSDETLRYVHWGTGIWQDIFSGSSQSSTLKAWLTAGGETLCRQAADVSTPLYTQQQLSIQG